MQEVNIFIKLNILQKLGVIYKFHHLIINTVLFKKTASKCQVTEFKNTKLLWSIESEKSERIVPSTIEGKSVKNYQDLTNVFNEYFINATDTQQTNDMSTNLQALTNLYSVFNKPYPQLNLTPVNAKEIKNIIQTLKWKNSNGQMKYL